MLSKIPDSQNRFEMEATLWVVEGLRLMTFTAFACKMEHTSKHVYQLIERSSPR